MIRCRFCRWLSRKLCPELVAAHYVRMAVAIQEALLEEADIAYVNGERIEEAHVFISDFGVFRLVLKKEPEDDARATANPAAAR